MKTKTVEVEGRPVTLIECPVCRVIFFRFGVAAWTPEQFARMKEAAAKQLALSTAELSEFVDIPGVILLTFRVCGKACAERARNQWIAELVDEFTDLTLGEHLLTEGGSLNV